MIDTQIIISSVGLLAGLGAVFGAGLAYASKVFSIETDPNVEKIVELLPGANCGACGYAGCNAYAAALAKCDAEIGDCPVCNEERRQNLAKLLGKTVPITIPRKARCLCNGSKSNAKEKFSYMGVYDCRAAILIGEGPKKCFYGCIGLGTCVSSCPFEAMYMGDDGLSHVIDERCTSCGKCVDACPKNLYILVPQDKGVFIKCSSHDKGKVVKEACKVGCIACGICVNRCPFNAISMQKDLAVIDFDKCTSCGLCIAGCPMHTINDIIPKKNYSYAKIDEEKCNGCGMCYRVCPVDAPSGELKKKFVIDKDKCIHCGLCIPKCPTEAIEFVKNL